MLVALDGNPVESSEMREAHTNLSHEHQEAKRSGNGRHISGWNALVLIEVQSRLPSASPAPWQRNVPVQKAETRKTTTSTLWPVAFSNARIGATLDLCGSAPGINGRNSSRRQRCNSCADSLALLDPTFTTYRYSDSLTL
jgi:hypothetical protein